MKKKSQPKAKARQRRLDKLFIGRIVVHNLLMEVFLKPGIGGNSTFGIWRRHSLGTMLLGADCEWHDLVKTLVHELLEVSFFMNSAAFSTCKPLSSKSSGRYMFVCDHEVLSDVAIDMGDVLQAILPELADSHKKWRSARKGQLHGVHEGQED